MAAVAPERTEEKLFDSRRGAWASESRTRENQRPGRDWVIIVQTMRRGARGGSGKTYKTYLPTRVKGYDLPGRFRSVKEMQEYAWPQYSSKRKSKRKRKADKRAGKMKQGSRRRKRKAAGPTVKTEGSVLKRSKTMLASRSQSGTQLASGEILRPPAQFKFPVVKSYGGWSSVAESTAVLTSRPKPQKKQHVRPLSLWEKKRLVLGLSKVAAPYVRDLRHLCVELDFPIAEDGTLFLDLNQIADDKVLQLSGFVKRKLRDLRNKTKQNNEMLQGASRGFQEAARLEAQQNTTANAQLLAEKQAIEVWQNDVAVVQRPFPESFSPEVVHHRAVVLDESEDDEWDPFCVKACSWKRNAYRY